MTIGNLRSAVKTAGRRKEREQVRAADRAGEAAGNAPEELPPVKMNRAVAVLCELALQNAQAQELIVDRIEELLEPMRLLPGGGILKKILARMPKPDNPASIHAFLESLPQPEKDALAMLSLDPHPHCGRKPVRAGGLFRHRKGGTGKAHCLPDGGNCGPLHGCCKKGGIIET